MTMQNRRNTPGLRWRQSPSEPDQMKCRLGCASGDFRLHVVEGARSGIVVDADVDDAPRIRGIGVGIALLAALRAPTRDCPPYTPAHLQGTVPHTHPMHKTQSHDLRCRIRRLVSNHLPEPHIMKQMGNKRVRAYIYSIH